MLKNINEVSNYIYSFVNLEKDDKYNGNKQKAYSLDNIIYILKYFNNPEKDKNIIHISGTKGKGSVSILISHLLSLLKFNSTTFLSPHLIDLNERILFNLNPIKDKELIELTNKSKKIINKNNLKPTTFEFLFIIYLLYSIKKNPDYLVIETGIGGRLDCTNIVKPLISVITPISIDHTNILGKTIKKITYEKGGIIKENKKVVIGKQRYISKIILKKIANKKKSKFYDINKNIKLLSYKSYKDGLLFDFSFNKIIIKNFFIPMLGVHQIYNFFIALQSVYLLNPGIIDIFKKINELRIHIPGRLEILSKVPLIILDVAHNSDSAEKLKDTLLFHYPDIKWIVLSGMTSFKDYKTFYKKIKKIVDKLIITSPSNFKNSNPLDVFNAAKLIIGDAVYIPSFEEAFNRALSFNKPLLVTGSFYIAGPFLQKWGSLNFNK